MSQFLRTLVKGLWSCDGQSDGVVQKAPSPPPPPRRQWGKFQSYRALKSDNASNSQSVVKSFSAVVISAMFELWSIEF